jgi:hypothetical protein
MSSGAYYEMRRKATKGGFSAKAFDKAASTLPGYKAAKRLLQTKRAAGVAKTKGLDTQPYVNDIKDAIEDLGPDIEVAWGTP